MGNDCLVTTEVRCTQLSNTGSDFYGFLQVKKRAPVPSSTGGEARLSATRRPGLFGRKYRIAVHIVRPTPIEALLVFFEICNLECHEYARLRRHNN